MRGGLKAGPYILLPDFPQEPQRNQQDDWREVESRRRWEHSSYRRERGLGDIEDCSHEWMPSIRVYPGHYNRRQHDE